MGARGPILKTSLALSAVAANPRVDTLAGDPHRLGNLGLLPSVLVTLNDQQSTVKRRAGITVGHENLRNRYGPSTSHTPPRGFSSHQADTPATNLLAGYN